MSARAEGQPGTALRLECRAATRAARILACVGVLALAWAGRGQAADSRVVARVGTALITEQDVDQRATELEGAYQRAGHDLTAVMRRSIRRQALEALVRSKLFRLEAARRTSSVSDAEAEAVLKRDPLFNPGGTFSQRAFENARHNQPAKFRAVLEEVKRDLAAQRFTEELRRRSTPSEDALRRAAERELQSADVDALVVPTEPISGRYREPSEREVLDAYRQHASELVQPAEATVEVVGVEPAPGAMDASAVRDRVIRAIASLKEGDEPAAVADEVGGSVKRLSLREDNYPGTWKATREQNEAIYRATPGTVLDEPVAASHGLYAVRVVEATPRHQMSLAEVADDIRTKLRLDARNRVDDQALHALYESVRDSMGRPGYKLRAAIVELAKVKVPSPTAEDLKRFYESHLADYTRYDAGSGDLVTTPLAQVRAELERRWTESRRDLQARDAVNRIADAWTRGTRDRAAEAEATVRDLGTVPYRGQFDLGPAGPAVSDTLRRRLYDRRVEIVPFSGGYAVANAYALVERVMPTFDQVRDPLTERLRDQQHEQEVARARALYGQEPDQFLKGRLVYYSRLWVPEPTLLDVPLTRHEIQSYYRAHLSEYASPERFRVRDILVRVQGDDPQAEERALTRARDLLHRIRGGADFADLARRLSDDDHTRDDGGDLSYRARGELDPPLEDAVFKMKVGQVSDVVRSTDGYHILQVTEHVPEQAEPLAWVYTTVGTDAALDKAPRLCRHVADSLFQTIRTPEQGRQAAAKLHLTIESFHHTPGDRNYPEDKVAMAERLEQLKPGEMYPGTEYFLGTGAAVMWVDSIAPPHLSTNQEQERLVHEYRRRMGRAAVLAKQAELDSLLRAGWSLDSLGALWGGLLHQDHLVRRKGLPQWGGIALVDSLVFGDHGGTPLPEHAIGPWATLNDAAVRLRVNARRAPTPSEIEARVGQDRGIVQEYRLENELKAMKQKHPVTILDPSLRETTLPPLPPMPEL